MRVYAKQNRAKATVDMYKFKAIQTIGYNVKKRRGKAIKQSVMIIKVIETVSCGGESQSSTLYTYIYIIYIYIVLTCWREYTAKDEIF